MHLYEPSVGFLGSNGVVPPGILIGAGAALSAKVRGSDQVAATSAETADAEAPTMSPVVEAVVLKKLPVAAGAPDPP